MFAAENNPAMRKRVGLKKSVADDFTKADPGGKLPAQVKEGKPVKGVSRSPPKRKPGKRNWYDHLTSRKR